MHTSSAAITVFESLIRVCRKDSSCAVYRHQWSPTQETRKEAAKAGQVPLLKFVLGYKFLSSLCLYLNSYFSLEDILKHPIKEHSVIVNLRLDWLLWYIPMCHRYSFVFFHAVSDVCPRKHNVSGGGGLLCGALMTCFWITEPPRTGSLGRVWRGSKYKYTVVYIGRSGSVG